MFLFESLTLLSFRKLKIPIYSNHTKTKMNLNEYLDIYLGILFRYLN